MPFTFPVGDRMRTLGKSTRKLLSKSRGGGAERGRRKCAGEKEASKSACEPHKLPEEALPEKGRGEYRKGDLSKGLQRMKKTQSPSIIRMKSNYG